jgi:hypothetical protein
MLCRKPRPGLAAGNYVEGFAEYEWRLHDLTVLRAVCGPLGWLPGRTLLLRPNRNGHTIQFVRYPAEVKLRHGRDRCLPATACVAVFLRQRPDADRPESSGAFMWAPSCLPGLLKHDQTIFPGIPLPPSDPHRVVKWKDRLAKSADEDWHHGKEAPGRRNQPKLGLTPAGKTGRTHSSACRGEERTNHRHRVRRFVAGDNLTLLAYASWIQLP